jgi:N-dimethylarginine dimethylaminohydrolase
MTRAYGASFGAMSVRDTVGELRKVLIRELRPGDAGCWQDYGWHDRPDPERAAAEHEALRELLSSRGAEVVVATSSMGPNPDGIYACDPALESPIGTVLLRPGKPRRRVEVEAMRAALETAGETVVGSLAEPATAEGGDLVWLDERTLLAGRSYRTNDAGLEQLRALLPGVDVLAFDLPHLTGAGDVWHLRSFLSMLDHDLAVAFTPYMPARLMELLAERGVSVIECPGAEFGAMATNVLALAPRVALALEGNPETRALMERAGVEVLTYRGDEISRKGDGGPTCLTRPLDRD